MGPLPAGPVRAYALSLVHALPVLGTVAAAATGVAAALFGASPFSDDAFLLGYAAAVALAPGVALALGARELGWSRRAQAAAYLAPFVPLAAWVAFAVAYGELHGPGLALMIGAGAAAAAGPAWRLLPTVAAPGWARTTAWTATGCWLAVVALAYA